MNIQETLNNLAAIGNQVLELQRQAKEARKTALEPFLEALAASGAVSIITVRGYTPGFNDGEPCTHSSDFWVNVQNHSAEDVDMTGDLEEIELEDYQTYDREQRRYRDLPGAIERNTAACAALGHVYLLPSDGVMAAIRAVIYDSIEEDNDTNYYVSFVLKDGKFVRSEGEYDCGY